jgi:hypothetical protein
LVDYRQSLELLRVGPTSRPPERWGVISQWALSEGKKKAGILFEKGAAGMAGRTRLGHRIFGIVSDASAKNRTRWCGCAPASWRREH